MKLRIGKIIQSSKNITPYGGLNFIYQAMNLAGLDKFLVEHISSRSSGSAYTYQGIIIDNEVMSEKEVIEFYNQRGNAENSNRYMLNDFNLHHLPFMDMDTNTVYMYFMAMCATLFEWMKNVLVKNKVKAVTISMRVKTVCFHYITVATTFIKHAHNTILKIFSTEQYAILRI